MKYLLEYIGDSILRNIRLSLTRAFEFQKVRRFLMAIINIIISIAIITFF